MMKYNYLKEAATLSTQKEVWSPQSAPSDLCLPILALSTWVSPISSQIISLSSVFLWEFEISSGIWLVCLDVPFLLMRFFDELIIQFEKTSGQIKPTSMIWKEKKQWCRKDWQDKSQETTDKILIYHHRLEELHGVNRTWQARTRKVNLCVCVGVSWWPCWTSLEWEPVSSSH